MNLTQISSKDSSSGALNTNSSSINNNNPSNSGSNSNSSTNSNSNNGNSSNSMAMPKTGVSSPVVAVLSSPSAPPGASPTPSVAVPAVTEVCQQARPPALLLTNNNNNNNASSITTTTTVTTTTTTSSVIMSVAPPNSNNSSPPATQHQFTVHGHFLGPGDHCGPAPNVTVNPLYQPLQPHLLAIGPGTSSDHTPSISSSSLTPPPLPPAPPRPAPPLPPSAADQQIRVLTPSEIMRTLPSLCQESYEPPQCLVRTASATFLLLLFLSELLFIDSVTTFPNSFNLVPFFF